MDSFRPLGDGVLVRRLPPKQDGLIDTSAHNEKADSGMLLSEGLIVAVGPGKWVDGAWWKVGDAIPLVQDLLVQIDYGDNIECNEHGLWEWIPGHHEPIEVRPGQKVIFNARWNDFTSGELVGSDCDQKGPLERPMPQWQYDKRDLHLITEGDIAGILS